MSRQGTHDGQGTHRWHSLHVYYHDADLDELILSGVRPLFGRLAGDVAGMYWVRHWRYGPHLRLNFRTSSPVFTGTVRPAAAGIVGRYLAEHPSTRVLDPGRELPAHQRLAGLENERGPLLPWFPNNSIQVAGYDFREEVLGNRAVAGLLADFHTDTTGLAFRMTAQARGASRLAAAFTLMLATAHTMFDGGICRSFTSFRSHAEGFLCGFPEGAGLRQRWQEHYRENAAGLARRVTATVAAIDKGQPAVPFAGEWIAVLGRFESRGRRLAQDGLLLRPPGARDGDGGRAARTAGEQYLMEVSPYHRAVLSDPGSAALRESPDFLTYRLMLNLTYLYLTRLGVAPAERFLLCHLAANAVEDSYGVSAFRLAGVAPGAQA